MKNKQKLIYTSKDYANFVKDATNRDCVNNKELRTSMKEFGWLAEHPAVVTPDSGKLRIVDGQNRFVIAKELGLPICYALSSRPEIPIARINNAQRKWNLKDYITSYASQGKADYRRLIDFSNETGFSPTACAALLVGKTCCGCAGKIVKGGKFKIRSEDHARSVIAATKAAAQFVTWSKNTKFVSAISQILIHSTASPEILCAKIRAHGARLLLCPTTDMFVEMLENIYNMNARQLTSISMAVRQAAREQKAK